MLATTISKSNQTGAAIELISGQNEPVMPEMTRKKRRINVAKKRGLVDHLRP
jgi:hypothetical protein